MPRISETACCNRLRGDRPANPSGADGAGEYGLRPKAALIMLEMDIGPIDHLPPHHRGKKAMCLFRTPILFELSGQYRRDIFRADIIDGDFPVGVLAIAEHAALPVEGDRKQAQPLLLADHGQSAG